MPTNAGHDDIMACLALVNFRCRQFHYAQADETVGMKNAMPEMALYDLEEAIETLREAFDKVNRAPCQS